MVNAWALAASILDGTFDEDYPIMKNDIDLSGIGTETVDTSKWSYDDGYVRFDSDTPDAAESVSLNTQYDWGDDGHSIVGNPFAAPAGDDTISVSLGSTFVGSGVKGGMGEDHISFNPGFANTAYDDPKYYSTALDFGDDPYPTIGAVTPNSLDHDLFASMDAVDFKPKPDLKSGSTQKYQEDKGIADLKDYVSSTYKGHYTNDNSDVQTLDLIHSVGDAESFCRSNALKYLSRYDKKGQAKRDILKAMHYCLLLYYFSGQTNEDLTQHGYETF